MLAPSLLELVQCMLSIIKFVGGKFRNLEVNHENNENWHPMKITRYTVYMYTFYLNMMTIMCNSVHAQPIPVLSVLA